MPPSSALPPESEPNRIAIETSPVQAPQASAPQIGQTPDSKPRKSKKPLLVVIGIILLLGLAGGTTFLVLSHVAKPATQTVAKTPQQQAAELAKQANDAATASANKGDTQGALDHYNEALIQYQKAGDKAGEEGVKLQIQYYKTVKANEEKAKAAREAAASSTDTNLP